MDRIIIEGGAKLEGEVEISGAKNACLPLLAACLLTSEKVVLHNVPKLADVASMQELLTGHGAKVEVNNTSVAVETKNITNIVAPYEIVRKMRASIWVLGPLVAREGKAKVSLPGGCAIGTRPIDLHLMALEKLGAKISLEEGYVIAEAKQLRGCEIDFPKISVGATANTIMAATLASGKTKIKNAAREPEVADLCKLLNAMGAKISGIGTSTIYVEGVTKLGGAEHSVIFDRIEAGTFIVAAGISGGEIVLKNASVDLLEEPINILSGIGVEVSTNNDKIIAKRAFSKLEPMDVETKEYPYFPTDLQAQFMTLLCLANGSSKLQENIFENRFMHVPELNRMGANILVAGNTAIISGVDKFLGAEVMATDLRASVSMVLAGLAATGTTTINRVYHIDRGYEMIVRKFETLGAKISRVND